MSQTRLVPILITAVAWCGACAGPRPEAEAPALPAGAASGTVAAVARAEERVVLELAMPAVEPGMPLRLLAADGRRIKGLAQATERAGEGRVIARLIALTDPADPPAPGDRVRELTDADLLPDAGGREEGDAAQDRHFAALREQYRRLLAEAVAAHEREQARLRAEGERRLAAAEERQRQELAERERLHAAALAQARAEAATALAAAVAGERQAAAERLRQLQEERERLRLEVDRLVQALAEAGRRLEQLAAERQDQARAYEQQLVAEREAREQLAARLMALERRELGRASAVAALLTRDPARSEGVLERLERLQAEASLAGARARHAEEEAAALRQELDELRQRLRAAEGARAEAEQRLAALAREARERDEAATRLERAQRELAAAELARLEAERALYDLAARVLRLPGAAPEVRALQERVRAAIAAGALAAEAADPERRP